MRLLSRVALAAAAFVAGGLPAFAEEVVLASGARYDARDVALTAKDVTFTFTADGGRATLTLPLERIAPESRISLLLARIDPKDGKAQLRVARTALEIGLPGVAAARFRRAAELDPSLAAERDAGLAAIRDAGLARDLDAAEELVKRGRNDLALEKAKDVAARAEAGSELRARAESLGGLAAKLADRDRERAKREAEAAAAAQAEADAAAVADALTRADKAVQNGLGQRAKAADPDVSASEATHALEAAEASFKEARRLLAVARSRSGVPLAEVETRDARIVTLVVATHLDLAELFRQDRRFDKARDLARAALVLDPASDRANGVVARIEADLRAPPLVEPAYDPFGTGFLVESWPYPYVRRWSAPSCGCGPWPSLTFRRTWSHGGFVFRW
jgi:hypothetical protein